MGIDQFFLDETGAAPATSPSELAAARMRLLADDAPAEERPAAPVGAEAPKRWRHHDGRWQRWSELDDAFVDVMPPASLLDHVDAHGLPAEGVELALVAGTWQAVG